METLNQNRLFHKREIKISNTKLFYHDKKIGSPSLDMEIPFEEISNSKISYWHIEYIFVGITAFLLLLSYAGFDDKNTKGSDTLFWILIFMAALFSLAYFFVKRENSWKIRLASGASIYIHKNIPNNKVVDEFIGNLFVKKNNYLRESYLTLDRNLSYENQFHNLKWLKSSEVITKEEFENKYDELKSLYNVDKKIGFGK